MHWLAKGQSVRDYHQAAADRNVHQCQSADAPKAQCPGVQAGGGQIKDCLKTHIKDLSDDCKAVLLKVVNAKACAADAKQFCADVTPGEGRLEACMKAHVRS